eukprot:UN02976
MDFFKQWNEMFIFIHLKRILDVVIFGPVGYMFKFGILHTTDNGHLYRKKTKGPERKIFWGLMYIKTKQFTWHYCYCTWSSSCS